MRVTRPDGELVVVTGATRSGKTAWTAQQVAGLARLLVWDSAEEWALRFDCERITSPAELAARLAPAKLERLAYVRPVTASEFAFFCRCAWVWLRAARGALVVEELADVTHPGKAPPAWGEIVRKGLRYGPTIYALTQRPSESDKTALGNATRVHAHRMAFPADREYLARVLGVRLEELERLAPLEYLERDLAGQVSRGRVTFGRAKLRAIGTSGQS